MILTKKDIKASINLEEDLGCWVGFLRQSMYMDMFEKLSIANRNFYIGRKIFKRDYSEWSTGNEIVGI